MLVKYWKNFKWFLFIPLIAFVFVFKISNVNAYVYKDSVYGEYTISGDSTQGTVTNGNSKVIKWAYNNPNFNMNYDFLVMKFGTFSFVKNFDSGNYCIQWSPGTSNNTCPGGGCYTCTSHYGSEGQGYGEEGTLVLDAQIHYSVNNHDIPVPCILDTGIDNVFYCPLMADKGQPTWFQFEIKNGGYNSINYKVGLNGYKYYYNDPLTEINIQQTQTNTNLQYIYQYQQNDSVSGSTTQATSDFSDLAQSFNSELAGVNDLSQLVLLPISLFMDLSTDNCQPLHLVVPFVNTSVDLPCMKTIFNSYFYGFYTIFTTIMSAIICYWVAIKTGSLIKDIVDCDNDRIEVIEL